MMKANDTNSKPSRTTIIENCSYIPLGKINQIVHKNVQVYL